MARPLVVRFGALGDMILLTPVLRALAERHGAPCDVVGSGRFLGDLYHGLPYVGERFIIGSRKTPYWLNPDQWALVRWLRARQPSPVYVLQSDALSLRLIARGCQVTDSVLAHPAAAKEHVVEHYARITATKATAVELHVTAEDSVDVAAWLTRLNLKDKELILLQPGNSRTMRKGIANDNDRKYWPMERWVDVAHAILSERPRARILVLGAPSERDVTEALAAACNDTRIISVAHDLPLRRLFALFTRAHSLISVDTGPAHAAPACGCPVAVLFAAADPRRIRPFHSHVPVAVVHSPSPQPEPDEPKAWSAAHSMDGITADAVLAAWRTLKPS